MIKVTAPSVSLSAQLNALKLAWFSWSLTKSYFSCLSFDSGEMLRTDPSSTTMRFEILSWCIMVTCKVLLCILRSRITLHRTIWFNVLEWPGWSWLLLHCHCLCPQMHTYNPNLTSGLAYAAANSSTGPTQKSESRYSPNTSQLNSPFATPFSKTFHPQPH